MFRFERRPSQRSVLSWLIRLLCIPRSQSHFSKECLIVCYLLWWCCHGEVFGRAEGRPHVALVWLGWFGLWGWHDLIDGRLGNTTKPWDDSNSLGSFFERKYRKSFSRKWKQQYPLVWSTMFLEESLFFHTLYFQIFSSFCYPKLRKDEKPSKKSCSSLGIHTRLRNWNWTPMLARLTGSLWLVVRKALSSWGNCCISNQIYTRRWNPWAWRLCQGWQVGLT